jgi:hypothetical protein
MFLGLILYQLSVNSGKMIKRAFVPVVKATSHVVFFTRTFTEVYPLVKGNSND